MGKIVLKESQLRDIVRECIKESLNELSYDLVRRSIEKMRGNGAEERAKQLGNTAVNNYGGEDLADQGYYMDQYGRMKKDYPRIIKRSGTPEDDAQYDRDMEEYNQMSPIGKFFHKEPKMPQDYGKPETRTVGYDSVSVSPKTDNRRIAHQAANFRRWQGDKKASSSNFSV